MLGRSYLCASMSSKELKTSTSRTTKSSQSTARSTTTTTARKATRTTGGSDFFSESGRKASDSNGATKQHYEDFTTEEYFKQNFNPKDFVEGLSRRLVYQHTKQSSDQLFDPAPFQNVFESTMKSLIELQRRVDKKITMLSQECSEQEKKFKAKAQEIDMRLEKVQKDFRNLDQTIGKISTNAVRIGASLESADGQKQRAVESKQYFKYIMELNSDAANPDEVLESATSTDLENAVKLRNLLALSVELDMPQTSLAKQNIEQITGDFERTLISRFHRAAQDRKYPLMNETARTLYELNGGEATIVSYINQVPLFYDATDQYSFFPPPPSFTPPPEFLEQSKTKKNPALEYVPTPPPLPSYDRVVVKNLQFFGDIQKACKAEYEIIAKVFPNPNQVMQRLVARVYEQKIQIFLESLKRVTQIDLNLFLRSFSHAVEQVMAVNRMLAAAPIYLQQSALDVLTESVLKQQKDEYIATEVDSLREYFRYEATVNDDGNLRTSSGPGSVDMTPDLMIRCMERQRDAVKRCAVLSHPHEMADNMYRIFQTFIREFGHDIMVAAVETAARKLSGSEVIEIGTFFGVIQICNTNVVLIQNHFFNEIRIYVDSNRNAHTLCMNEKNRLLEALEERICAGLDKVLSSQIGWVEKSLYKFQQKNDFRPDSTADISFAKPTKACAEVCRFVREQRDIVTSCLDGKNLEAYSIELSSRFLKAILRHIRKFTVEKGLGGLALLRDLTEYQNCVGSFKLEKIRSDFDILAAIAKLHLVSPEQMREVIKESPLARLPQSELETFITMRSDWQVWWKNKWY